METATPVADIVLVPDVDTPPATCVTEPAQAAHAQRRHVDADNRRLAAAGRTGGDAGSDIVLTFVRDRSSLTRSATVCVIGAAGVPLRVPAAAEFRNKVADCEPVAEAD